MIPTIHYFISLIKFISSFDYYVKTKNKRNYEADKTDNGIVTKVSSEKKDSHRNSRLYPFSTKEWYSSIYSYNKSFTKSLVANNYFLNLLLKSYLNMIRIKRAVITRRRDNKSRYSAKKVYTSRAELEHTNSRLLITLFSYNKKKAWFEGKVRKIITLIKFRKIVIGNKKKYIPYFKNRLVHLLKKNLFVFDKWNTTFFKEKTNLFEYSIRTKLRKIYFYFYRIPNYNSRRLKKLFKLKKALFHSTNSIHFTTSLLSNIMLNWAKLGLVSLLEKLYGKKTKINLVESKALYLNSDVFSSAVALKLRDRKNKVVRVLRKAVLQMAKIADLHTLITFDDNTETLNKNNVVNNIKQQAVSGVRFEASGRLTRRLTAMRAVFKYRYAGSLKNIRSSFNNESAPMIRGHLKSNLQHSLINSKTRNGTFGLKSWVGSH